MPYTQIGGRVQARAATGGRIVAMMPVSRRTLVTQALLLAGAPALSAMRSSRVEDLIGRMTIAEKAGQLSCFSDTVRPLGRSINPAEAARSAEAMLADIRAGQVGMLFNGYGVAGAVRAQRAALASRLGIPLAFAADIIHGYETIFRVKLHFKRIIENNNFEGIIYRFV